MAWWRWTRRPDRERKAGVGVQHRRILHIAVDADADGIVVAAQGRAKPHAGVFGERHVAMTVAFGAI